MRIYAYRFHDTVEHEVSLSLFSPGERATAGIECGEYLGSIDLDPPQKEDFNE